MNNELLKVLSAFAIFATAMASGFLPLKLGTSDKGRRLLILGSAFAGGVFLGAGLIHMIGDSQEKFSELGSDDEYPLALLLAGIGLLMVLLIEKVAAASDEATASSNRRPYLLLAVLSVHSLIAGTSLGLEGAAGTFVVILIAILAHKGFAAFSLGVSFNQAKLSPTQYRRLLLFFSLTTPLGVILGTIAASALHGRTATRFEAIFDGLAAGTFLYVATLDLISETFEDLVLRWGKFFSLGAGFSLMALIAIWS
jgi:solute carrier family 39 (zinc transporter), member 1/2/3